MEAMVSRVSEQIRDSVGRLSFADTVSVWTEYGHFQMPYHLFQMLFGISLPGWCERKIVELPDHKAKVESSDSSK